MNIKDILTAHYDRKNWQDLLCQIFKSKAIIYEPPSLVEVSGELAKRAFKLGEIKLADYEMLAVYEVELTDHVDIVRNRRGIRDMLTSDWKGFYVGALVISFRKNESILRFSYVSENFDFNERGEYIKTSTDTKRFTYLLGEGYSCRTAVEQFVKLSKSNQTLADVTAAFNVEALSKEFFSRYKDHYTHFVDYMVHTPSLHRELVDRDFNDTGLKKEEIKDREEKPIRDYVKKLLGRIVFLHFLQKKGWLGVPADGEWGDGKRDFMFKLFNEASEEQKQNFLDEVLKPLFSDGLDTDRKADNHLFDTKVSGIGTVRIPYLNGGLFERDELDEKPCSFPPQLFEDLLDTFSQYNFTIDENDPNDAEVGVDPEMLGRIFENLLEDNKDKGAYYTPKEIVQYMCRESLIAYLQTDENAEVLDGIRQFVTKHDANELSSSLLETIGEKLRNVKICDPAIGSGAFPMGLLRELFFCRCAIDPHLLEDSASIKRHIIQSNIYGVDIERGAVDIARLRFWLSLIVDEKDPTTLPNLDFKIMQGNSLLESYMGVDLRDIIASKKGSRSGQIIFDDESCNRALIQENIDKYFKESDHIERKKLRDKIDQAVKNLIIANVPQLKEKICKLDMQHNSEFFLWHTWFNDVFSREGKEGFDIVIGNPPYIKLSKNKGDLSKLYADCGYDTFRKDGDIYCLFYEKGYQLLNNNGHLCYITSNKWMRGGYGENTRFFFATKTNPKLLLDFGGVKVFKTASVDPNILLFAKSPNEHRTLSAKMSREYQGNLGNLNLFMENNGKILNFPSDGMWVLLSPTEKEIKRKIETVGTPLKDWDIQINYGIKTGNNKAFIISSAKRDEILSNCQSEDERKRTEKLIRPVLKGQDVKRYGYKWAGLWLINTHNGLRGKLPRIDINDYPAVKHWLDVGGIAYNGKLFRGYEDIAHRSDQGDTPYNLRNCTYLEDFDKPKIIYPETTQGAYFVYDDNGMLIEKTCFMLISPDAKYIQATLSSKLFEIAYKSIFSSVELGENGYQYNKDALLKLPVVKDYIPQETYSDEYLYSLYNLTPEEIEFIESQLGE